MERLGLPLETLFAWHCLAELHIERAAPSRRDLSASLDSDAGTRADASLLELEVIDATASMTPKSTERSHKQVQRIEIDGRGNAKLGAQSQTPTEVDHTFISNEAQAFVARSLPAVMKAHPEFFDSEVKVYSDAAPLDAERGVKTGTNDSQAYQMLSAYKEFRSFLAQERKHQRQAKPVSEVDAESYQKWRKAESGKGVGFWKNRSISAMKLNATKELLQSVLSLNGQIDKFQILLDGDQDLDGVETAKAARSHAGKALQYMSRYAEKTFDNTRNLFRQSWSTFKSRLRRRQDACAHAESDAEVAKARNAGHISGEEMLEDAGLTEEKMHKQLENLDPIFDMYENQDVSDAELQSDIRSLNDTSENFLKSAKSGAPNASGITATMAAADNFTEKVCKDIHAEHAMKMKHVLKTLANMSLASLQIALPGYGMRGISATIGGAIGGLEEVVDFRNREIGYFRYGSLFVGSSMLGVGAAGYVGIGWKGYKENWTLEEAYQTAIWMTGPSVPIPTPLMGPLGAGLGVGFATDADDSGPLWIMELHGVNGVTFGPSVSASLLSPLPGFNVIAEVLSHIKYDFGLSKYWMHTSECFQDLTSFLRGVYKTWCATCEQGEAIGMGLLRTSTHLVSFPVVSEMLFTFLAWSYEKVRPEGYRAPCSESSTQNRNDPRYILASVTRQLTQAVIALQQIEAEVGVFRRSVKQTEGQTDLVLDKMWRDLAGEEALCRKQPHLPLELKAANQSSVQEQSSQEAVEAVLVVKQAKELAALCMHYKLGRVRCNVARASWGNATLSLAKMIAQQIIGIAHADNPFGSCSTDEQCLATGMNGTKCSHYNGRKSCVCGDSHCLHMDLDGEHLCRPLAKGAAAPRQVVESLEVWIGLRQVELGAYVKELERILSSPDSAWSADLSQAESPPLAVTSAEAEAIIQRYDLNRFAKGEQPEEDDVDVNLP